jgi:ribonuclease J
MAPGKLHSPASRHARRGLLHPEEGERSVSSLNDVAGKISPGLRLVPLGGLGEIGMNCMALEQGEDILLIDCGVTFPTTDLGIDVYHPRFDYVLERKERVRGIVLTHGHEDHIGGLPYLLSHLDVPVWGPAHTLELARQRLEEHGFEPAKMPLLPARPGKTYEAGSFSFEPIRVTHSIADAIAIALRTSAGLVVHTGDFKLDPSPPDGELTDEARLGALGDEGVSLLLSDSTNVDSPGRSTSELDVGERLGDIVKAARTRVVIGMFASNVQRLQMLGRMAMASRRYICLLGRSVVNHVKAAQAVGRLAWPSDLVISPEVAASMARERVLIVASGTQAERNAALPRLANGTHPTLRLDPGDVVILSSRVIPGNDRPVMDMMADFLRLGAELTTRVTDSRVHASGHAHREEQMRMIELTRPRAFLPVHGTLHHLTRHAALARDVGVDDVLVAENGDVVELGDGRALAKAARAPVGKVATFGGDELPDEVIRERAQIGRSGLAVVSVVIDRRGLVAAPPRIVSRGVIDDAEGASEVMRAAAVAVARALGDCDPRMRSSDEGITDVARLAARRAIEGKSGRRPVVLVSVSRLGTHT